MNIIAIMGPHGVYYKDEPIKELEAALQRQGFQTIWPQNSADLLQFIEHNPRICGVIFDWDEYSVDLCSDINRLNEYLPLYAFINAHSTMDVSSQDLRMTLWFFEYALGLAEERFSDDELIDAMLAHPVLINRPIVVTAVGTKLCRPSEAVLDILPQPQRGAFSKEDGEPVVDAAGNRIA